jgi:hypothetical protein
MPERLTQGSAAAKRRSGERGAGSGERGAGEFEISNLRFQISNLRFLKTEKPKTESRKTEN